MKRTLKMIAALSLAFVLGMALMDGIRRFRAAPGEGAAQQAPVAEAVGKDSATGAPGSEPGKKIKYWVAPMDPTYIRNEPGKSPMGMDLVPVYEETEDEKEPSSTVRIDPITMQNMGIRTGRVERQPLVKSIRTFGNITFNETRIFAVNTKFNGWIERIYVNFEGERVKKGQPLFDIYSPEVVTAQEEYLLAVEQYRKFSDSRYDQVRESAVRLRDASRSRLRNWDLRDDQIRKLEKSGRPDKTVTVFAPASGVVIRKVALEGHYVKAGDHQYEIADLSDVWVDVDIYEYELPFVQEGMPAIMDLSYLPGKRFHGNVLYIYPFLSPKTRTAKLRLQFPNPEGILKPAMYANVYLESQIRDDGLVIPEEAVIDSGIKKLVFVLRGKGKFEPREVKLGYEVNDNRFQVLEGLQENEEVVVSAQFLLDSESRLREAVGKMLEARESEALKSHGEKPGADDLDMEGLTMDEGIEEKAAR